MPMSLEMSEKELLPELSSPEISLPRRLVLSYAPPEAFASMTRAILAKLGYAIVAPEDYEPLAEQMDRDQPDLRIVDERSLSDVPEDGRTPVPIIALTGRHGVAGCDLRIAGAIKRPAGIHELYQLMQQVLEDKPRATPRVPTHLPATAAYRGCEWSVSVLSLSENGCLIRSAKELLLGSRVELRFQLPNGEPLELDSEIGYQLVPDLGLIFHATLPAERAAISRFVETALSAG
jgi:hypothetical protein